MNKANIFTSMASLTKFSKVMPGARNPSYVSGNPTKEGCFVPEDFALFQNDPNNDSDNTVWHIEAGNQPHTQSESSVGLGALEFDISSKISGAQFRVRWNLMTEKVIKLSFKYEDFDLKFKSPIEKTISEVLKLLTKTDKELLQLAKKECHVNPVLCEKIDKFISSTIDQYAFMDDLSHENNLI